jgi:hypothetical protein
MRKIGNLRKVISSELLSTATASPAIDPVRARLNANWIVKNNSLELNTRSNTILQILNNKEITVQTSQQLNTSETAEYTDFNFSYVAPFENSKNNGFSSTSLASKLELKSNYISTNTQYDKASADASQESLLIDYNTLLLKDLIRPKDGENTLQKILLFNGAIASFSLADDKRSYNRFLNSYSLSVSASATRGSVSAGKRKTYNNVIIDGDTIKVLNSQTNTKKPFLNNINLKLTKDTSKQILNSFKETNLNLILLKRLSAVFTSNQGNKKNVVLNKKNLQIAQQDTSELDSILGNRINEDLRTVTSIENASVNYYSINEFINTFKNFSIDTTTLFYKYSSLDETRPLILSDKKPVPPNLSDIFLHTLAIKLDTIIKDNIRSYEDMINGKECHSEIIGFKIEKRRKLNNALVQTIIFENNDSDYLEYYDTQILKNTEYTYELKYLLAVLGNKYSYKKLEQNSTNNIYNYKYQIINEPEIGIFEVNANPVNSVAMDLFTPMKTPPAAPVVIPITFKDVSDKIKFNFIKNTDRYREPYIIVQDQDIEKLQKLWQMQDIPDSLRKLDTSILFSSELNTGVNPHIKEDGEERFIEKYEIFKTTVPPTSYADFKNKLLTTISKTSFLDDKLEPNTKYYYMFRSINSDSFTSNPTNVFEIELVRNSGVVYPIIKDYQFEELKISQPSKEFNKYLFISPAYLQTLMRLVNESQIQTATTDVFLGPEQNAVWNKKFKIRLTSKQTGRKIDVNFTMKYGPKIN